MGQFQGQPLAFLLYRFLNDCLVANTGWRKKGKAITEKREMIKDHGNGLSLALGDL